MKDNELHVLKHYQEGIFWLQQNNYEKAFTHFNLLHSRVSKHDPQYNLYLSYFGLSLVHIGETKEGLNYCRRAANSEFGDDQVFYNLACAALVCNNRKCALSAISQGKIYNPSSQLLNDLRKSMGIRRAPILSFFSRNNLVNKLLGKLTYKKTLNQLPVF